MTTDSGIRIPLSTVLRRVEIFQTLGDEEREAVASRLERRRFRGGDQVFQEGDPSDGFYIVHSGEVGIVSESAGERRVLARLGTGECFGEMSLLTGEPRSTSVYATLDAELLFLGETAFEDLLRRYPAVALGIGRTLSLRLRRANLASREESRERILLCVSLAAGVEAGAFASDLAKAVAHCRRRDILLISLGAAPPSAPPALGAQELRKALRGGETPELLPYTSPLHEGVRVLSLSGLTADRDLRLLGPLLGLAVAQYGGAVVASEGGTGGTGGSGDPPAAVIGPFGDEALRQSDAAIVIVDASADSLDRGRRLVARVEEANPDGFSQLRIALLRKENHAPGTIELVESRVRRGVAYQIQPAGGSGGGVDAGSIMSLARRLSHGGVGIALGGGGARGLAHIGILEVFASEGVPIDVIGGTSIGSIISALHAVGHAPPRIAEIVRREWVDRNPLNDFTFPRSALIRGLRGERVLRRVLGEVRIEDLAQPYFAVAADLVSAEEVVLSRGPLWLAVRASGSIPVLLNPVKADGRFLVDGGVINNVPGDHLARFGADITIAVDVSPRRELYFERVLERPSRAGFFGRLARRSRFLEDLLDYPGLLRTLRRVIAIEGFEIMKTKSASFDICIQPKVDGFDLLDFSRIDRLMEAGREAALQALPAIRRRMEAAAPQPKEKRTEDA